MKQIFIIMFMLLTIEAKAQCFIDSCLEAFARQTLFERGFCDDYTAAGIVILESSTGKVIADICHGYVDKSTPYINSYEMPMAGAGISMAVLYLAMMEVLRPSFLVDINGGLYNDSITGCTIIDHNYKWGGYTTLNLEMCMDRSSVGMVKACEVAFSRNAIRYERALKKTGIMFENYSESDDEYYDECDSSQVWSPCDIIGYRSSLSLYQMTAWLNATVNGGKVMLRVNKNDSKEAICEIKSVGLSDLKSAMNKAVAEGLGKKMQSKYTTVGGVSYVSPRDEQGSLCTAIGYFPTVNPKYTVGCLISKKSLPAGRLLPTETVGKIINYLVENHYLDNVETKYHRAEK